MPWVDRRSWPNMAVVKYDYHEQKQDWYYGAKISRAFHVTDPYFDEGGSDINMVSLTVPVFVEDYFVGVAGADLALDRVEKIVGKIRLQLQLAVFGGDDQLIVEGVKYFNSILSRLGKGHAVPGVFVRAVLARRRLAGPAGHFELGPARLQSGMQESEFDFGHGAFPQDRAKHASPDTIASSLDAGCRQHPR